METEPQETGAFVELSYRVSRAEFLEVTWYSHVRLPLTWILGGILVFLIPVAFRAPGALVTTVPLAVLWFFTMLLVRWLLLRAGSDAGSIESPTTPPT
jgi:hypothetical protein